MEQLGGWPRPVQDVQRVADVVLAASATEGGGTAALGIDIDRCDGEGTEPFWSAHRRMIIPVIVFLPRIIAERPSFCGAEANPSNRWGAWWAHQDSNLEPRDYESPALTIEL